jgi:hypothetical protein
VVGEKKCKYIDSVTLLLLDIKSDDICHLHVPYYEGLSIDEIV